jgi:hypothetical protein
MQQLTPDAMVRYYSDHGCQRGTSSYAERADKLA